MTPWHCRSLALDLAPRPLVMGILNVTPDSFSDGGRFAALEAALDRARRMIAEGADLIDVGGESTRPGSEPVPADEEIRRVVPVIERLRSFTQLPISIDTSKAAVAREALKAGADIVNDVTALADPLMPEIVAEYQAGVVLMHMQGTPQTMQLAPSYADPVAEIAEFLAERIAFAISQGIPRDRIAIDPGIGFGKTAAHNRDILVRLAEFDRLQLPLVLGVSRKGFIGEVTGRPRTTRAAGTAAIHVMAQASAHVWRVHDVAPHADAARICGWWRGAPL